MMRFASFASRRRNASASVIPSTRWARRRWRGAARAPPLAVAPSPPPFDLPTALWRSSAVTGALEARATRLRREGASRPHASPDLKAIKARARSRAPLRHRALQAPLPRWAPDESPGVEAEPPRAEAEKGPLSARAWRAVFDAQASAAAVLKGLPSFMSSRARGQHVRQTRFSRQAHWGVSAVAHGRSQRARVRAMNGRTGRCTVIWRGAARGQSGPGMATRSLRFARFECPGAPPRRGAGASPRRPGAGRTFPAHCRGCARRGGNRRREDCDAPPGAPSGQRSQRQGRPGERPLRRQGRPVSPAWPCARGRLCLLIRAMRLLGSARPRQETSGDVGRDGFRSLATRRRTAAEPAFLLRQARRVPEVTRCVSLDT